MKTFFLNTYSKLNSFVFVIILITVGVLIIVLPKEKISQDEKRVLTRFPVLTQENLFSGKYFEGIDLYYSDNFIYLLGCLPFILIPYDIELKHYRNILSLGAHSIIYSRKMRDDFLSTKNQYNIKDWDEEMLKQTRYSYHQIL